MGKLTIVGLGPGAKEHLTMAGFNEMKNHQHIYLRTAKHPVVEYLRQQGIEFQSYDRIYEKYENFEEVYQHITEDLIHKVKTADILYAVPGNPYVAEYTVQKLIARCQEEGIERRVYPAMSFVEAMFSALEKDPVQGFKLIDGMQLEVQKPDPSVANIITQVYDPFIASQVKLKLMDHYDDQQEIYVVRGAGIPGIEKVEKIPLYQLDHLKWLDYLTSVYIPSVDMIQKKYYNMNNLVEIMERLRSEEGCPWDREQTHSSLKPYLIEECYEVLEAIDKEDDPLLEEELGDLLLQAVFHSQIAKERKVFDIEDVIQGICQKLLFRHPHVFKGVKANNCNEAVKTWELQKREEKQMKSTTESMKSIPKHLPALMKAYKIQKKAADVGFDWEHAKEAAFKIKEEMEELLEAKEKGSREKVVEEAGDLLFAVVNVLRLMEVEPEGALNAASKKFVDRFHYVEETARKLSKDLKDMTLEEMEELWEQSKVL